MFRVFKIDLVGKRIMVDIKLDLFKKIFEVFVLNIFKVNRFEFI